MTATPTQPENAPIINGSKESKILVCVYFYIINKIRNEVVYNSRMRLINNKNIIELFDNLGSIIMKKDASKKHGHLAKR
jgi:hypothetical protein